jgi:hypothetical protein
VKTDEMQFATFVLLMHERIRKLPRSGRATPESWLSSAGVSALAEEAEEAKEAEEAVHGLVTLA